MPERDVRSEYTQVLGEALKRRQTQIIQERSEYLLAKARRVAETLGAELPTDAAPLEAGEHQVK